MITVFALSPAGAALIGAGTAALINVLALVAAGIRQERQRRRDLYADALEVTLAYREFAYAVPRRRHDARAEERVRISEAMREVQRDLSRSESLMKIERAGSVAAAYRQLVSKTRETAGGYLREGWKEEPITDDHQMNVPGGLDFTALDQFEKAYLDAVANDLAWHRFWR